MKFRLGLAGGADVDRRERIKGDWLTALTAMLDGFQAEVWTALPCVLQTFDPVTQTCTAKPGVAVRIRNADGSTRWLDIPLLVDVPVVFPGGGGWTLTFPMSAGDDLLVVFSTLCIDSWFEQGGVDNLLPDLRLHDLSDGFAIPKPRSKPSALDNFSMTAAQLRSDDGLNYVEVADGGVVRVEADTIQLHARRQLYWDVNGFGYGVTFDGAHTWNAHTWQTPTGAQVVTTLGNPNIVPPEQGSP